MQRLPMDEEVGVRSAATTKQPGGATTSRISIPADMARPRVRNQGPEAYACARALNRRKTPLALARLR